jgi:hypothetical protein
MSWYHQQRSSGDPRWFDVDILQELWKIEKMDPKTSRMEGGPMTTHSKGKYIAYRSGRNNPTKRELAARKRVAEELKVFCEDPFPNGAVISRNANNEERFVMDIKTRSVVP